MPAKYTIAGIFVYNEFSWRERIRPEARPGSATHDEL